MCGILGVFQRSKGIPALSTENLESQRHRGPDAEGIFCDEHIGMGHTRLSIIDLSDTGAQPMQSRDKRYTITFNGEIFMANRP